MQGGPAQSLQEVRLAHEKERSLHTTNHATLVFTPLAAFVFTLLSPCKQKPHTCLHTSVSLQTEAQGRMEAGGNPPYMCRENTRKLKASGNVLTSLKGCLDGRLFSNIIWRFSLEPPPEGKLPETPQLPQCVSAQVWLCRALAMCGSLAAEAHHLTFFAHITSFTRHA